MGVDSSVHKLTVERLGEGRGEHGHIVSTSSGMMGIPKRSSQPLLMALVKMSEQNHN